MPVLRLVMGLRFVDNSLMYSFIAFMVSETMTDSLYTLGLIVSVLPLPLT